jgi:uncharacterized protein (TIGR03435 family)
MSTRILALALAEICLGAHLAPCQTEPNLSFDAVSVKKWNGERIKAGIEVTGGRLEAGAITLRELIAEAYGTFDNQITGASDWMDTERFNVFATAGRPATRSELRAMLQNVLAERFHLLVRREPRQMKAYALVVDNGGPKLTPKSEPLRTPPGQNYMEFGSTMQVLLRHLNQPGAQRVIGRPVVDRSGITGEYHIALPAELRPSPDGPGQKVDIEYFSALRGLGLRLDTIEETFDRIVVVSATRPTPD